jgi:Txe/YoeB family toxin of Txe-Axe toxin-antitoxin module
MYRVRLVKELFEWKTEIEEKAKRGDKTDIKELKLLNKAIDKLKYDFKSGQILQKKVYPSAYKEYSKKYADEITIDKLWVLKISSDWRVIYTVVGNEVDIISFILDSMNHKKYDRKFNF